MDLTNCRVGYHTQNGKENYTCYLLKKWSDCMRHRLLLKMRQFATITSHIPCLSIAISIGQWNVFFLSFLPCLLLDKTDNFIWFPLFPEVYKSKLVESSAWLQGHRSLFSSASHGRLLWGPMGWVAGTWQEMTLATCLVLLSTSLHVREWRVFLTLDWPTVSRAR